MVLGRFGTVVVLVGCVLGASVAPGIRPRNRTGPAAACRSRAIVSLKSDQVNVRAGPTKDHDVAWVYTRSGLPVEVTAEFENWRRIRDWEGAEGWVYHSLLSGRRTALWSPRRKDDLVSLYDRPTHERGAARAAGRRRSAQVKRCEGWCRITGNGFDGWIEQPRLWGV